MGMTFSNAAVKFENSDLIKEVASAQPPVEEGYEFDSFYLLPPANGWSAILAPEDHPANSFSLAKAVCEKFDALGFAGFVSDSIVVAARFFKGSRMIYDFRNDGRSDEFQVSGDINELIELFQPQCPEKYDSIEQMFRAHETFAQHLYGAIVRSFSLPAFMGEYGHRYVEQAEYDEGWESIFGEDVEPEEVPMNYPGG